MENEKETAMTLSDAKTISLGTKMVDIDLIQLSKEAYPRLGVSENVVETYASNMEAGVMFAPLVVQKGTYKLIDGWHRYDACKRLKIKKVKVEILDIPDSELRLEAVKRNVKHGQRLTKKELYTSIILLRFEDKKSLKEIASIVDLSEVRVSQICKEYQATTRYFFNNLNSLDSKVDLRVKVDTPKRREILRDLTAGMSGTKVAEKHKVSEATVSLVKKEDKEWLDAPVYIEISPNRMYHIFRIAFANKLLEKARFEFKEDGITVRNSNNGKKPFVVAQWRKDFFVQYKVRRPIDGYATSEILGAFKGLEGDTIEVALINEHSWKARDRPSPHGTGHVKKQEYPDLDWREFEDRAPRSKIDIHGIPETCTVKALVDRFEFPRKQKGTLRLKMEDKKEEKILTCSYSQEGWNCGKKLKLHSLVRVDDASAVVDLRIVDEILKAIGANPVAIGMWSDNTSLALGYCWGADASVCFII